MPEIAFLLDSSHFRVRDLVFATIACDIQMRRDFAPAWGFEPWPCVPYGKLPPGEANPIVVMDNINEPGATGFHTDVLGAIWGRVQAEGPEGTAITMSHEALEMRLDPTCDLWVPIGDGRDTAKEACDAVEGDTYQIPVDLFGEQRQVHVSNFLLPAWFDPAATGPYDYLGRLTAPMTMTPGGYMSIRDVDGNVTQIFASEAPAPVMARVAGKLQRPTSRTARRVAVTKQRM